MRPQRYNIRTPLSRGNFLINKQLKSDIILPKSGRILVVKHKKKNRPKEAVGKMLKKNY